MFIVLLLNGLISVVIVVGCSFYFISKTISKRKLELYIST